MKFIVKVNHDQMELWNAFQLVAECSYKNEWVIIIMI